MFLYSIWCDTPLPTRQKIAAQFGIIKRGSTEVVENVIKSDGYVIKEVEQALNIDAIQKYLETDETDMMVLWGMMIAKIEGRVVYNAPKVEVVTEIVTITDTITKKRGRPKNNV